MGFFPVAEAPTLPTQDILSWLFDAPDYDVNKPVHIITLADASCALWKHVD